MPVTKIDLNIVWDDAKAMAATNRDLLTAIAGMFLLLPLVVSSQLLTVPQLPGKNPSEQAVLAWYEAYMSANWVLLLVVTVVTSFGTLSMLALLLRPERLTVAESLKAGVRVLPGYVLTNMLQSFGIMAGLMLFLIPGFYLIGRFALVAAVAAAEGHSNPLTLLRRSAALTHGNGWRIFFLLAVIVIVLMVVNIVATVVVGIFASLLLPPDLADFAMSLISGLFWAGIFTLIVLISAALYRAATAPVATRWEP
jgi:hypothetical protein